MKTEKKFDSHEYRILIVTCFGHFMSHFNMLVFPALLLPLVGRMDTDMATVLGISFWMYLMFGLTALPWGLAADRLGAWPFMLLFFLGSGLSGLAAAWWIDSPNELALALATLGIFSGIYHPTGLGLISKEVKRVSLGMGYNGMFGNLGLFAAPLITGIVNWLWGIRAAYLVLGVLNFAGAGLMLMTRLSCSPQETQAKTGEDKNLLSAFMILLAAMMLGGICYRAGTVIMPSYIELKTKDIFLWMSSLTGSDLSKNLVATSVTSVIYLVGMLGQYTGGRVAEKFDPRFSYLVFYAVTIPFAFFMANATNLPLVILAILYFFFFLGLQPIENTLVTLFTPVRFRHAAFGAKFVLVFGVGAIAVKMVEVLETTAGIETVFIALGVLSLILTGIIGLLILNTRR